jgi:hypothetical protein
MGLVTLSADAWTELADTPGGFARVRVRSVEPTPPVWLVAAPAAPTGPEPDAAADCELLDADKRETVMGGATGSKVFARVRGRGLVNRVIVSDRKDGLA